MKSSSSGLRWDWRRVWVLWLALALLILVVGGFAATRSEMLDVDRIEVHLTGGGSVSDSEVVEAATYLLDTPMVKVDVTELAERVAELIYVREVEVERDWPDTLRVWVSSYVPAVNASSPDGSFALLAEDGTVLERLKYQDSRLPVILVDGFGSPGSQVLRIEPLLNAADAVTDDLGAWIRVLEPVGDGVRAQLVGGVVVELGLDQDYREKMRSLASVLTGVELSCIKSIDVTIPHNPVVVRSAAAC